MHLVVYGEDGPSLVRVFDRETGEIVRERPAAEAAIPMPDRERPAGGGDAGGGPDRAGAGRADVETLYSLGIPRGAVPPGRCRVWDPDLPVAEQEAPAACDEVRDRVGGDDWLLHHRPAGKTEDGGSRLVVAVYEDGTVASVRVFDAGTGTLVEERTP